MDIKREIYMLKEYYVKKSGHVKVAIEDQMDFWENNGGIKPPLIMKCTDDFCIKNGIKKYNEKDIHFHFDKMQVNGLIDMIDAANGNMQAVPSMRANMGCGIFPTMLGVEQELFDDKMPWVTKHLSKQHLSKMTPDDIINGTEFSIALEHMDKMKELLKDIDGYVFPLDLQGPFDMAHIIYGDQLFYDIYDDVPFMHHLLDLSTQTTIKGMEMCLKVTSTEQGFIPHYNGIILPTSLGGLKISEDTSTLVSQETIREFVVPYTRKILEHFGGGYIHYCGKNDHLLNEYLKEPLVCAINLGNPDKHDMNSVLQHCVNAGKVYYGSIDFPNGITHTEFFEKLLSASKAQDGMSRLLMAITVNSENINFVTESWSTAVKKVLNP